MSTSISILAYQIATFPNKKYLALRDFDLIHKTWKGLGTQNTQIEKSEQLVLAKKKWEME